MDAIFYIDNKSQTLYKIVSINGGVGRSEPIITKEAFMDCYNAWIKKDVEEDDGK